MKRTNFSEDQRFSLIAGERHSSRQQEDYNRERAKHVTIEPVELKISKGTISTTLANAVFRKKLVH